MIHLTVNNRPVSVPDGTTILDAAKKLGINIPTLCYLNLHDINYVNETASCRVCMVEVEGFKKLFPACATPVTQNMRVHTDTAKTGAMLVYDANYDFGRHSNCVVRWRVRFCWWHADQ